MEQIQPFPPKKTEKPKTLVGDFSDPVGKARASYLTALEQIQKEIAALEARGQGGNDSVLMRRRKVRDIEKSLQDLETRH